MASAQPQICSTPQPTAPNSHRDRMLADVVDGLSQQPKTLPAKYFYDAAGAKLFEQICQLPEYYPTRTERSILQANAADMAAALGSDCLLIEPGSGAGEKARLLLAKMRSPTGFVPIDVAAEQLQQVADNIHMDFAQLPVVPIVGDFSRLASLPDLPASSNRAVFFPGSTIGNFAPAQATELLARFASWAGVGGRLLLGVDLVKPVAILEAAYNDAAGITAEFNLNMLRHINRELNADFALDGFRHQAPWQPGASAIRMELVATHRQTVQLDGRRFVFAEGEPIHTEYSHKYTVDSMRALLAEAGWHAKTTWQDEQQYFAVFLAEVKG